MRTSRAAGCVQELAQISNRELAQAGGLVFFSNDIFEH